MDLLTARTANEQGQASLQAAGVVLETSRKHVHETTEMLQKKMEEVDRLRNKKVDDQELTIHTPVRRVSLLNRSYFAHHDEERKASWQNPRIWMTFLCTATEQDIQLSTA